VQKNHLLIFGSFLDIWENVEWPRFLDHPVGPKQNEDLCSMHLHPPTCAAVPVS